MKWNDGSNLLKCWNDVFEAWSDTVFECPEDGCDGIMQRNNMMVLTSNPPQYEYRCKKCGKVRYRWQ